MRKHFLVFRAGYDPFNVATIAMRAIAGRPEMGRPPTREFTLAAIKNQRQSFSHQPDVLLVRRGLAEFSDQVRALQKTHVRIGFFQMPIEPALEGLAGASIPVNEARRVFPTDRFCWVPLRVPGGAHTLDGIHLNPMEAAVVAQELVAGSKRCLNDAKVPL